MAATGSGLPAPPSSEVLTQPTPGPARVDAQSSADAWTSIANSGAKIAEAGFDVLKTEEHIRKAGAVADAENAHDDFYTKLNDTFRGKGDPDGYAAAAQAHNDGALPEMPDWMAPHFTRYLGAQMEAGIRQQQATRYSLDDAASTDALDAKRQMADRNVIGLAMDGQANTPTADAAVAVYNGVVDTLVSGGKITPEKATLLKTDLAARAGAEVTVKDIGDTYRANRANGETAGPIALRAAEDRILRGDLPLTADQRYSYFHKATAEIRALEAERKQDLGAARASASDATFSLSNGVRLDASSIDSIADRLNKAGGQADAARLRAAAARAEQLSSFNTLPLPEQFRQISALSASTGVNASPDVRSAIADASQATGAPLGYLNKIAARESGFNPDAKSQTSSAGGLFQFTDNTWKDTLGKYGARHGLTMGASKFDPKANALMAGELTTANALALIDAGIPVNDGTLYAAHFAGASGAAKLLKADPSTSAVDLLPDAAAANKAIFYDAQGAPRSAGQVVQKLTAGTVNPDGRIIPAVGADLRLVTAEQKIVDQRTQSAWESASKDLDAGIRPNPAVLDQIVQGATLAGNHNLLETVGARLDRFDKVFEMGRHPISEQQAAIGDLASAGATGDLSPGAAAWGRDLKARNSSIVSGLKDNPITTTVTNFPERFRQPAPLDVANSDNFRAGLLYRGNLASFAAQNWKAGTPAALDGADLKTLGATLDVADPPTKARIFSDITASLPEPVRNATLAALGSKGPSSMIQVYAGALYAREPDLAASILRGQSAEQAEPRYNPTKGAKRDDFNKTFDEHLPATAFAPDMRVNDTGAMATMRGAATARYADLSAQAGDTSGEINENRLTKAIDDVSGGVVHHNGGPLIAPERGMPQSRFDAIVTGLNDSDLAGVTTLHGAPVTADYLRRSARLETVGDGRYLVQIGNNPSAPLYAVRGANTEAPYPFVLDLRGRRAPLPLAMPIGDPMGYAVPSTMVE